MMNIGKCVKFIEFVRKSLIKETKKNDTFIVEIKKTKGLLYVAAYANHLERCYGFTVKTVMIGDDVVKIACNVSSKAQINRYYQYSEAIRKSKVNEYITISELLPAQQMKER